MHVRAVLRTPGVLKPFAAALVGRLPMAALGLLFVLHVEELTGSFALAGLASGAYALGLGVSGPLLGRLVDARGQRSVLPWCAAGSASALVVAALLPVGAPAGALVALAALAGVSMPPLGACLRALWMRAVPDPDRRHAAFALDSGAGELLYVVGPAGLAGGIGAWSPRAAILVCAALILTGAVAFAAQVAPAADGGATAGGERRAGGLAGALGSSAVRSLVVVFGLLGLAFGAIEVGVASAAAAADARGLAGPLLGLWGVGSVLGGVLAMRWGAPRDAAGRLIALLGALALAHAPLAVAGGPLALAPLLLISGVTIAPVLTTAMTLVGTAAPPGTTTEAFTWASTGITAGIAVGAAAGGALVELEGSGTSFALAACACACAAGVGFLRRPALAAATA